ncbi:hypothetical protein QRX50_35830 [Amycolatopsis carbonis]|uniref:Uncharacterized protein n=1 Tax=Amycolatopsis carbonis TaxID=715471 RepID=A0A9Y2IE01_9PSEU|nr:hypothetical protein [Amycolatopsis sp. 2-15]WIX76773.1 hypothetical protein QRX50_35830 [Amycolatopsis sp. 2-15]
MCPQHLQKFLELTSTYAGYDFDGSDWAAITAALDSSGTTDYPLIGRTELAARIHREDDGDHVAVTITGPASHSLGIRLRTLFDVLNYPGT